MRQAKNSQGWRAASPLNPDIVFGHCRFPVVQEAYIPNTFPVVTEQKTGEKTMALGKTVYFHVSKALFALFVSQHVFSAQRLR